MPGLRGDLALQAAGRLCPRAATNLTGQGHIAIPAPAESGKMARFIQGQNGLLSRKIL